MREGTWRVSGAGVALLLEEIVEGGAGVGRGSGSLRGYTLRGGGTGGGYLAGDCDARVEELALVACILGRDPNRDGLQALEAGGWLEMRALLAAMQVGVTFRTRAFEIDSLRERSGAIPTTRRGYRLNHAGKAGPSDIDRGTRALRTRTVVPASKALVLVPVAIHVAVGLILTVAVHGR